MFKNLIFPDKIIKFSRFYFSTESVFEIIQSQKIGEKVNVKGWVKSLRKQKEHVFLDISDGSTPERLQILIPHSLSLEKLSVGSSLEAHGILTLSPKGQIEISAEKVSLLGECDINKGYPFAPRKSYAPEYIRDYLHLRPRTKKFTSLLRLRHKAMLEFNKYLDKNSYVNIQTPILTSNDCEGAGEVFKAVPNNLELVKNMAKEGKSLDESYFDRKVFLSVSGQLHLEAAVHALHKVYTIGPTFRAENSRSRFHLAEFYMLEAEVAFIDKLDELMEIVENMVKDVTRQILKDYKQDLEICTENKMDFSWLDKKFNVLTYELAITVLREKLKRNVNLWDGMTKEDEIQLVEYLDNVPTFIINWPKLMKPFYMKECKLSSGSMRFDEVEALDLLAPRVGEIVGGSLREDNYEKLKSKLPAGSDLEWYLDLRRFGSVPTGGFGLGFERFIQLITETNSIKDCIPFPRWPHNCSL